MADITFYFDVVSPYSYFAFVQRHRIREAGHDLLLRPASVRAIMKETGNVPTSVTCAPKMAYGKQDLARWAKRLRLPIKLHPEFGKFSSEPLLAAIIASGDDIEAMAEAAFHAVWQDQAPVSDEVAMRAYFEKRVPNGGAIWDRRNEAQSVLQAHNSEAVKAGAFGVPLFVASTGLYFGNDRIDFLLEDLSQQTTS